MVLSILLAAAAQPAAVDFKGIPLGISLAELRERPPAAGNALVCSGEPDFSSYVEVSSADKRAGVTLCYYASDLAGGKVREWIRLNDDHSAPFDLLFFEGRLFRIDVSPDISAAGDISDALTAKFGTAVTKNGEMQVRSGAKFPQVQKTWRVGASQIVMISPDFSTEKMSVTYTDMPTQAKVDAIARTKQDPRDTM